MRIKASSPVLIDLLAQSEETVPVLKQVVLVVVGIVVLAISAKIKIPMWPVPITMGTFAVLSIGAAYGARLGIATILGYLLVGALGMDVFAGSSSENYGISYMVGGTGGYLLGYVIAVFALGMFAQIGWDRSPVRMACALLIGNILIYIPGLMWLGILYGWDKPIISWGLTPFLIGDAAKLVMAALLIPAIWKFAR